MYNKLWKSLTSSNTLSPFSQIILSPAIIALKHLSASSKLGSFFAFGAPGAGASPIFGVTGDGDLFATIAFTAPKNEHAFSSSGFEHFSDNSWRKLRRRNALLAVTNARRDRALRVFRALRNAAFEFSEQNCSKWPWRDRQDSHIPVCLFSSSASAVAETLRYEGGTTDPKIVNPRP